MPRSALMMVICSLALVTAPAGCKKKTTAGAGSASAGGSGSSAASGSGTAVGTAAGSARKKLAKAMGTLAKASKVLGKHGKLGPVVPWKQLSPFLPQKLGKLAAREPVHGETTAMGPMRVSTVRRAYGAKKSAKPTGTRARVQIVDTAQAPMMRAVVGMGDKLKGGASTTTESTTIGGQRALVRWNKPTLIAKISVLAGGRFLVNVGIRPIESAATAKAMVETMELGKLAALAERLKKQAASGSAAGSGTATGSGSAVGSAAQGSK